MHRFEIARKPATTLLLSVSLLLIVALSANAQVYPPGGKSPHDAGHLISILGSEFHATTNIDAPAVRPVADRGSSFPGGAMPIDQPLSAPIKVRQSGKYVLWARIGIAKDRRLPVEVNLSQAGKTILAKTVASSSGAAKSGGSDGYQAFAKQARSGKLFQEVAINPGADAGNARGAAKDDAADLLAELKAEATGKPAESEWVTASRLEQPLPERPFYWWKLGEVELTPGEYSLQVAANTKHLPREILLDGAFLSTRLDVEYPFAGDVAAPPASYVRFRIDEMPEGGINITARMRIHRDPWQTGTASLNPDKPSITGTDPHTKMGLTRWYRLQDLENAPAFGAAQGHLLLQIAAVKNKATQLRGATQLATFPHGDYVLREFDWSELGTDQITMATDFATHLDKLRTVRDQAREHYQFALDATGGEVFPLTRGDLNFCNSWGGASGEAVDYMNQTLRLLGFNSVGRAKEPVKYAELYGGTISGGHYWPPAYVPFNEAESVKKYDDHYRDYFAKNTDRYKVMSTFQVADEPGEIRRREMTSPFWRMVTDEKGPAWADLSGNSSLFTKRTDLANCVLEGSIEKHGTWVGIYVGVDQVTKPQQYAFWKLGQVSVDRSMNLSAGLAKAGVQRPSSLLNRPGASLARTATPFKIVYDGKSAALYLKDKLVHQLTDLPPRGGFALVGAAKSFRALQLRKIRPNERLTAAGPELDKKPEADILAELGLDDKAAKPGEEWARKKSLADAVREDWVIAGGMPEAHAGFRRWAAEQGLSPELFGQSKWEDVRMLTLGELVETPAERRLYYWSRRYSGWLTPRMFQMAAEAIQRQAPRRQMQAFVALSGHSLYFPSEQPLDMFQLAGSSAITPGVSDWMSLGGWFWDSHQAVAYSVAPYNAGARRYGQQPLNHPMMHCVWPSAFRSYTMLANQVRTVSYFNYGPSYAVTEGYWSDNPGSYHAVHRTNNHAGQLDDILANANMRPARVAMLYSMSNEYWQAQSSFADKRATFLALSHEYYQPELVTEQQVSAGALEHYDALLVLDPLVATDAQEKIAGWVRTGGLLWTCADALTKNEYNEPADLIVKLATVQREFSEAEEKTPRTPVRIASSNAATQFRAHSVAAQGRPSKIDAGDAQVRAKYDNGNPAWIEQPVEQGRVVYVGHRAGLTYMTKKVRVGGRHSYFADTGRALLTQPLDEVKVKRELVLSEPCVVASPLSCEAGTVIVLYNMQTTPCTKLQIGVIEEKLPHSVEIFDGDRLVPLPHELREGRLWMELPELVAEQMILVRYQPAPADSRRAEMLAEATKHLQSTDATTLAAGAWLVGRMPEAKVDARLVELLSHDAWIVRRAAAESLGRRGKVDNAAVIRTAMSKESDPHVLADSLLALGRLGDAKLITLADRYLDHPREIVRRSTVEAVTALVDDLATTDSLAPTVKQLTQKALQDADGRVVRAGIALLAKIDDEATLRGALDFYSSDQAAADRATATAWVSAIVDHDEVFERYLSTNAVGGETLLLAVSARRADPRLATLLRQLPVESLARFDREFVGPALRQRDPALARRLFEEKEKLPKNLANHVTLILQTTFDVRLGNVAADWQAWLAAQPAAAE